MLSWSGDPIPNIQMLRLARLARAIRLFTYVVRPLALSTQQPMRTVAPTCSCLTPRANDRALKDLNRLLISCARAVYPLCNVMAASWLYGARRPSMSLQP